MDRDLVDGPYGRFFHLPRILAERVHEVSIVLLDYKNGDELQFDAHGIRWISSPVISYLGAVNKLFDAIPLVQSERPEVRFFHSGRSAGTQHRYIARPHQSRY